MQDIQLAWAIFKRTVAIGGDSQSSFHLVVSEPQTIAGLTSLNDVSLHLGTLLHNFQHRSQIFVLFLEHGACSEKKVKHNASKRLDHSLVIMVHTKDGEEEAVETLMVVLEQRHEVVHGCHEV